MALTSHRAAAFGRKRRLIRGLAVATVASSALFLAPSGAASGVTQTHPHLGVTAPGTGDVGPLTVTAPGRPDDKQLALDTLAEVIHGDFTAVSSRFDEAMRQAASPAVLEESWKSYQAEFGEYRSHGEPQQVASDHGTVVNVPLRMAKHPGEFRVTFDEGGHLLGLYFLRPGVPIP